jgi:hypothetical protein
MLNDSFMKMKSARFASLCVDVSTPRRKNPLPSKIRRPTRRLPRESARQRDTATSRREVASVKVARSL